MDDPFADIASVLHTVSHRVGSEIMVIGAHARDAVLAQLGAQPGRQTEDVDVVVGIPAGTSYRAVVQALGTPVNEKGYTFTVEGMPVDVLPSIDVPEEAARFSPARDIVLDVRGQAEAYASAMQVEVAHDCVVRVPTAEALALLKVIAWNVRRGQTSKDAKDLRALLDAMVERRLESDALWESDTLARFDHDPDAAAWWIVGSGAIAGLPVAARVCAQIIAESGEALLHDMGLSGPLRVWDLRLAALRLGLEGR